MKRLSILFCVIAVVLILFFRGVSYRPPDIDHAKVIRSLNASTLQKGKDIYKKSCLACHGADGTASLPQARSFNKDRLRFGNKPYDMWRTITNGAGMMPAQSWLSPAERYYVIQYIREEFMKKSNPRQYFKITEEYLSRLPKSQRTIEEQEAITKREALKGSLKYGQEWFMHNKSDYGNAIHSQLKDHGTCILTVILDSNVHLAYNLLRMGTVAAWRGKLNVSDTKYNRYRGEGEPFVEGDTLKGLHQWQWTYNGKFDSLNRTTGKRAPLASGYLDYHGHYTHGKNVILSYSVMNRKILEHPEAVKRGDNIILSQTLQVEPGAEQKIIVGKQHENNSIVISSQPGTVITTDADQHLILTLPTSTQTFTLKVLRTAASNPFTKSDSAQPIIAPGTMISGGPALWREKVNTKGKLNAAKPHFDPVYHEDEDKTAPGKLVSIPADYPYTVDNIGLPFDNAYNSWIRPTSLGFMSDGRLVITTYMGDVWMASGIDSTLKNITWQRIAAGLYEPMGMKIIKDRIYVTSRNGIVILNDLNGDCETDYYENFFSDNDVSAFFHAFNFGLETDSRGNFYYAKPGEYTDNKDPGNVIKVSPDGKKWESIATGFRVDNGITITPNDRIFVSDNQGNWTPGNKINFVEKGKFYGYVQNIVEEGWSPDGIKLEKTDIVDGVISPHIVPVPDTFAPPALWMPQEFDNSPGGGVWSSKEWGPLGDRFIHTSYGTGWVYYFLPHTVDGVTQGAMVALPFQFDAGIQRAAVNPVDGQVYTTGLTGWDDGVSTKYGVLGRVRYKGGDGHIISDAEVVKNGIKLSFNFPLDEKESLNPVNYKLNQWNYKWTSKYGSAHYSVKNPGVEGVDVVAVKKVIRSEDGRSVVLEIPGMVPVQTMRIRFQVKGADGVKVKNSVYLTIHKIPQ